jgi:P4 family phage/plasmid primase-like protien
MDEAPDQEDLAIFVKEVNPNDLSTLFVKAVPDSYELKHNEYFAKYEEYKIWKEAERKREEFIKKNAPKEKVLLKNFQIDNYLNNVAEFYLEQPFFYNKQQIFWFWQKDENKWEIVDEIDLMNSLDKSLGFMGQTVSSGIKRNYIEAFKRIGRTNEPKEAPKKWIQFKNKAYSLKSKKIYDVTPDYFFTNPIPWEIGDSDETPIMDKLMEEWVGKKYVKTLYELIAYCCYSEYPIQLLFCLYGNGRNGKSQFQKILNTFIGKENICSTELDTLIDSRFEAFKLYKKLICSMGETNFGILNKSSMIKKLTGGDTIGFEMKNKNPFDDYNYAKMIISSNSLPSSNDTSDGWYRRWMIIDFPNEFEETGQEIYLTIPEIEYKNLSKKVCNILSELLNNGKFTNQGNIEERKNKYIMASNPLSIFLAKCCNKDEERYMSYNELYSSYLKFLRINKNRKIGRKEFKSALEDEGFFPEKTSKADGCNEMGTPKYKTILWVDGLGIKTNWESFANFAHFAHNLTQLPRVRELSEIHSKTSKISKENILLNCSICGSESSKYWDITGKPICEDCKKAKENQK